jgi:hypothetical protein
MLLKRGALAWYIEMVLGIPGISADGAAHSGLAAR